MNKLIEAFARRGLLVDLLTIGVFVLGIVAVLILRREVFPNITLDFITVSTVYPGASPQETENLITNPLEQELLEVDGIKKMVSASTESRSFILLQIDPDESSEDKVKSDVQEVVDAFTALPEGAEDPVVTGSERQHRPIIRVALVGDAPPLELRKKAKNLEYVLRQVPGVARIDFDGLRDLEIKVDADPDALRRNRTSIQELRQALARQNVSIPGGTFQPQGEEKEIIIRTVGEFKGVDDVLNTVIRANPLGQALRVSDVATVQLGLEEPSLLYRVNGTQAIALTIVKKEAADAVTLVDDIKAAANEFEKDLPNGVGVSFLDDTSLFIRMRLSVLTNNMMIGLALVLITLSLILPWRTALVAAVGIPFAFLVTMLFFEFNEISFNLISMMGLIIVVGMLVDDAIVVTENAQRRMDEGESPLEAGIHGTQQIWMPVTASVLTTVMAFVPLMMMSGVFGKFVSYIPIGVVVALLASLFECFFILPNHIGKWVKPKRSTKGKRLLREGLLAHYWDNHVTPIYGRLVRRALKGRYVVLLVTLGLIIFTGWLAVKKVPFVLFPAGAIDAFVINVEAPLGTPLETTFARMKPLEKFISKLPPNELDNFTVTAGSQMSLNDVTVKRGGEYGQVVVYLRPVTQRDRTSAQIADQLRQEIGEIEGLEDISFRQIQGGPPVGMPISVGLRGDNYEMLSEAAYFLRTQLDDIKGIKDIQDTFVIGKQEIQLHVDAAEAAAAGISAQDIGATVRAAYEGIVSTSIKRLDEEIDIRVRLATEESNTREALEQILVANPAGGLVPLNRVVSFRDDRGIAVYEHEANKRQVRVEASVDESVITSQQANATIERDLLPELRQKFPDLEFSFGGEVIDTQESLASLFRAFLLAVFSIYLILVLTFQSYFKPLLILTTVPLGLMGVVWTFFLHGRPLSFLGTVGLVALSGVIVNNAIVFVDFVISRRKEGLDRFESIITAGMQRVRPIFLTTFTTVVGLLPTAYGIGGLDPFVVPIALALGWGMLFGSLMTSFVFPATVAIFDDVGIFFGRLFSRNTAKKHV